LGGKAGLARKGAFLIPSVVPKEWALKAIDPALAPKPLEAIKNGSDGAKDLLKADQVCVS
jgi:hypothetical protein